MFVDVVIPALGEVASDHMKVGVRLAEVFSQFVFQLEVSARGHRYWQCRGPISCMVRINIHYMSHL